MQRRAGQQPEPTEYDLVALRKDGAEIPVHIAVTLASLADGPAGVAFFTDISERTNAEVALRDSEARFRGVFEQAALGIALTTPEGRFLRANRKFCEMLGYTEGELSALTFRNITHPDDLADNIVLRERALAGEFGTYAMEKRYIRKDGTVVWTSLTSSLVREPAGEPVYMIGVSEDITARKMMEDAIRDQREQIEHVTRVRSMGELTATLAHELSQPLTAIVSNAHAARRLLDADPPDLAEAGAALGDIASAGQRAGDVIRRLRALLRKAEPRRTPLNINQLIVETIPLVKGRLQLGGIALRTHLEPGLPPLHGDQIELQQALLNLLLNALDAMHGCQPDACELAVSSAHSGPSTIQIDVCDAGAGLDERELARVFEPFYTTKPDGLGMGLPIAQTIVARARRTDLGDPQPGAGRHPAHRPAGCPGGRMMPGPDPVVYVVDDDAAVFRAVGRLLAAEGLHVETFASPAEFLRAARREAPRCLVLDVRLPGQDGLDLQAYLQSTDLHIPIIFITGYGEIPMTVQAMKAGAVDFLTKPFTDCELLRAIDEALDRDRRSQAGLRDQREAEGRYATLTPREREVFHLVVAGMPNKQIARQLAVTEQTVKVHRSRAMAKMRADSLAELVRIGERLRAVSPKD